MDYIFTKNILADGLTKALPADGFKRFREQVKLVDITDQLQAKKAKELTEKDFELAKDQLFGGESTEKMSEPVIVFRISQLPQEAV